jgi:prepilin-type N-terminal cleavage/methylation domain-containing protein
MKQTKGFTLIELLVVVAIIGILATVVLASVGSSRPKAQAAKVKAQLAQVPIAAELYYDDNGDFGTSATSCTSGMFTDVPSGLAKLVNQADSYPNGATVQCASNGSSWGVSVAFNQLNYCVDSIGLSVQTGQTLQGGACA